VEINTCVSAGNQLLGRFGAGPDARWGGEKEVHKPSAQPIWEEPLSSQELFFITALQARSLKEMQTTQDVTG